MLAGTAIGQERPADTSQTKRGKSNTEAFAAEMQKLRDTWVQEFNAGHADKVAAFYAPEAVLMRWDGSVHGYDSILAEMQRSVNAGAHDYVVHSLHVERSGDVGYDTGAYNVGSEQPSGGRQLSGGGEADRWTVEDCCSRQRGESGGEALSWRSGLLHLLKTDH